MLFKRIKHPIHLMHDRTWIDEIKQKKTVRKNFKKLKTLRKLKKFKKTHVILGIKNEIPTDYQENIKFSPERSIPLYFVN